LYPSIPIDFGIKCNIDFAERHWDKIDNLGINIEQLKTALSFICYNYEIQFDGKVFKQIKGCPMGSHFASHFATIALHHVESYALDILKKDFDFSPTVYKRYLDDILLGPIGSFDFAQEILTSFNSVNAAIQFTLDYPQKDSAIAFLDIELIVTEKDIDYWWFVKPTHSDITLQRDSWVPSNIKSNFVTNSYDKVANRCSSEELRDKSLRQLQTRLIKNGFRSNKPRCKPKILRKDHLRKDHLRKNYIKLDFISDRLSRKINKIIEKYDFNVRLINKPANNLKTLLNSRASTASKHKNCDPCNLLPDSFNCTVKYVVYKFTCKSCNRFYIGETCRPFYLRYREHRNSVNSKDFKSALSEHIITMHRNEELNLSNFDLQIVSKCKSPVETRLTEAREITNHRDLINRKHERF